MAVDPVARIPVGTELPDVMAAKAVADGTATEDQQKRFVKWVVETVANTYGMPFDAASERVTDLNQGKRYVGWCLVNIINMPVEAFKQYFKQDLQPKGADNGRGKPSRKRK